MFKGVFTLDLNKLDWNMNQTHEVIYCKRTKNRMMSQDVTLKRTQCSRKPVFSRHSRDVDIHNSVQAQLVLQTKRTRTICIFFFLCFIIRIKQTKRTQPQVWTGLDLIHLKLNFNIPR